MTFQVSDTRDARSAFRDFHAAAKRHSHCVPLADHLQITLTRRRIECRAGYHDIPIKSAATHFINPGNFGFTKFRCPLLRIGTGRLGSHLNRS